MPSRELVGLIVACVLCGCDGCGETTAPTAETGEKKERKKKEGETTVKLDERCDALAKACGDQDKHKAKITEECKEAAKKQAEKGCTDKVVAVYDCYEKEICAPIQKVWVLDDFRVLTTRHKKCTDQVTAVNECINGAEKPE